MSNDKKLVSASRSDLGDADGMVARPIESSRNHDMRSVLVDFAEKDGAKTIIVYLKPDLTKQDVGEKIAPAVIHACKKCFGPKQNKKYFDLVYRDQDEMEKALGGKINLESGGQQQPFDTLEVHIKPPKAQTYDLGSLKRYFLSMMNQKL